MRSSNGEEQFNSVVSVEDVGKSLLIPWVLEQLSLQQNSGGIQQLHLPKSSCFEFRLLTCSWNTHTAHAESLSLSWMNTLLSAAAIPELCSAPAPSAEKWAPELSSKHPMALFPKAAEGCWILILAFNYFLWKEKPSISPMGFYEWWDSKAPSHTAGLAGRAPMAQKKIRLNNAEKWKSKEEGKGVLLIGQAKTFKTGISVLTG